jgi:Transglycosylase-like domain
MTTDRGARVRAVKAAGATAAILILPAAARAADLDDPPAPRRSELSAPVGGHLTVAGQMRAARRAERRERLVRRVARLEHRVARVRGERPAHQRLTGAAPTELAGRVRRLRRELRAARREHSFQRVAVPSQLAAIAACESGGNYATNTGNGFYGAYQFDLRTWQSVGGAGLPSDASPAEQDMRAALLYQRAGAAPWPVCGR